MVRITNRGGLAQPIVDAILADPYDRGEADYTVTELIAPVQQRALLRQFGDTLEEDAADRIHALTGQLGHTLLERAGKRDGSAITEQRLYMDVLGKKIGGQVDRVEPSIVVDYKFTSVWSVLLGHKPEWEAQLNLLAHLCRAHGLPVTGLEVNAIFRDWQRRKARYDRSYPQTQAQVVKIPMWTPAATQAYLEKRVRLHVLADTEGVMPLCTSQERWERPAKWAVMRPKRKSALRVLDSEEEAQRWIDECTEPWEKAYIEHRQGENVRCSDYCICLPVCQQGLELVGDK